MDLPDLMILGELSTPFRLELWHVISESLNRERNVTFDGIDGPVLEERSPWGRTYIKILRDRAGKAHNDISYEMPDVNKLIENIIRNYPYDYVFDLIEEILKEKNYSPERLWPDHSPLLDSLMNCFNNHKTPYRLVERRDANFVPSNWVIETVGSKHEGDAVNQSVGELESAGMPKAIEHLNKAARHIRQQEFSDSVADSVNAVESVAVTITSLPDGTLSDALKILTDKKIITHPALIKTLKGIYGYAGDEGGIRHADHDGKSPNVDIDEAVLMFGTCASLAGFLARKRDKISSS